LFNLLRGAAVLSQAKGETLTVEHLRTACDVRERLNTWED
jgi:hypothetical protein